MICEFIASATHSSDYKNNFVYTDVQCPELVVSPQSNAYYSDNNLQGWGRKVVYECNNGYSLSQNTGKYERICQKNGTWSGQSPVCLGKSIFHNTYWLLKIKRASLIRS